MTDLTTTEQHELAPMTAEEARSKTDKAISIFNEAYDIILELYERRGWIALGYPSWREYVQAEFGASQSRIYELKDYAITRRNLATSSAIGGINERQARPLTKLRTDSGDLDPQAQQVAWQTALETAPDGKVTGKHVQEVVNAFQQSPVRPGSVSELKREVDRIKREEMQERREAIGLFNSAYEWEANADVRELVKQTNAFIQWIALTLTPAYQVGKVSDPAAQQFLAERFDRIINELTVWRDKFRGTHD